MSDINKIVAEITASIDVLVDDSDSEELILLSKSVSELEDTLGVDLSPEALQKEIEKYKAIKEDYDELSYSDYEKMVNAVFTRVGHFTTTVTEARDYLFLATALIDITKNATAFILVNEPEENQQDLIDLVKEKYNSKLNDLLIVMESKMITTDNSEDALLLAKATNNAMQLDLKWANYNQIINMINELEKSINSLAVEVREGDNALSISFNNSLDQIQGDLDTLKAHPNPHGINKDKVGLDQTPNFPASSNVEDNGEQILSTAKATNTVWLKVNELSQSISAKN